MAEPEGGGDRSESPLTVPIVVSVKNAVLVILGIVLIVDAAFGSGDIDRIVEISVGLVLIGALPIDAIINRFIHK